MGRGAVHGPREEPPEYSAASEPGGLSNSWSRPNSWGSKRLNDEPGYRQSEARWPRRRTPAASVKRLGCLVVLLHSARGQRVGEQGDRVAAGRCGPASSGGAGPDRRRAGDRGAAARVGAGAHPDPGRARGLLPPGAPRDAAAEARGDSRPTAGPRLTAAPCDRYGDLLSYLPEDARESAPTVTLTPTEHAPLHHAVNR